MQSPSRPDDAYGHGAQSKQNETTLFAQMHCSDRMFEDVVVVGLREGESICTALAWQAKQTKDDTRFTIILCSLYVHGCKLMTFFIFLAKVMREPAEWTSSFPQSISTVSRGCVEGEGRSPASWCAVVSLLVLACALCPMLHALHRVPCVLGGEERRDPRLLVTTGVHDDRTGDVEVLLRHRWQARHAAPRSLAGCFAVKVV